MDLIAPANEMPLPEWIVTHWQCFSCGHWRVPKGDIDAAYSVQSLPRVSGISLHS